jgi:hypothetical protein
MVNDGGTVVKVQVSEGGALPGAFFAITYDAGLPVAPR